MNNKGMTHVQLTVKGQANPITMLNTRIHPLKMELKRLRLARKEVVSMVFVNNPTEAGEFPNDV